MKKDGKILRDPSGHESYVCRTCRPNDKTLIRINRKGYEDCQKLNLCLLCYNMYLESGKSISLNLKEQNQFSLQDQTAAESEVDEADKDTRCQSSLFPI